MEFESVLALRQSTRSYTQEPLTSRQVEALLSAARHAPVCLGQFDHVHLIVVQDKAVLDELNSLFAEAVNDPEARPTYGAPAVIFVCNRTEDEEIVMGANASCIMENMLLSAADQGLAAVYLFGISQVLRNNARFQELLRLPEGFRTVSAIAVGHSDQPLAPRAMPEDNLGVTRV